MRTPRSLSPLLALTLLAGSASANSETPPSLDGQFAPGSDDENVPLNTLIYIHTLRGAEGVTAHLIDEDGVETNPPILEEPFLLIVTPDVLQSEMTYTLSFSLSEDQTEEDPRDPIVFRTATAVDETPPVVTLYDEFEIAQSAQSWPIAISFGALDQDETRYTVTVGRPDVTDDHGIAGYRLIRLKPQGGEAIVDVKLAGESGLLEHQHTEAGDHTYLIETFDFAGNTTTSDPIEITIDDESGGGCASTNGSSTLLPLGALAFLLMRVRRRASHASHASA